MLRSHALWLALAYPALAQTPDSQPLTAIPYTPSLDLTAMDRSADPCTDFYKYSCGGWIRANPIPADQARWDVYGKLTDENMRFLWGLLEQAAKPSPDRNPVEQKIGDYFASCMDESAIEALGAKPLQPDLDRVAQLKSIRDLPALLSKLHLESSGSGILFGFGSSQDFDDSTKVIAFAYSGGLGLPDRDYYTKTDPKSIEIRARYLAHVQAMLEMAGETPAAAKPGAQTVMDIETELAKASLTRVERRDPYKLKHPFTRAQLEKLTPSFDWNRYLSDSGLATVATVNVTEPKFYGELDRMLGSQSLDRWKVYLRWHLIHSRAAYLSSGFVTANFDFYSKYLQGVKQMPPRWKRCVRLVDQQLGEALGQEFVAKTFSPETKQRTVVMTQAIEKAMESEIRDLPWMSPETKQRALLKLHSVVNKVGYPDRWRDYSSLTVARGDFAGNVERGTVFESRRDLAKIGKPLDRGEWDMTPPTVNADYNPQMNDINFPAGVLQPPLFDPKMDDAPNYGNTGATIGHELTHGFDDEGRQFDDKGNLKDWWTKEDAAEFEKRTKCVSDQYAQYTVIGDIKINSKLTLGEDVADLGGTLLAYIAWKAVTQGQDLQPVDGLSPDQRFFVGMAQWACGSQRPEARRAGALVDPHSPDEYRINGVVANMPEFGRAFACRVGQPMMRENACRVW